MPRLKSMPAPVLVISAEDDQLTPPNYASFWKGASPMPSAPTSKTPPFGRGKALMEVNASHTRPGSAMSLDL